MGWVIESLTGKVYDQAATELVLGPAGMKTATFDLTTAMAADHAVGSYNGHTYEPDAFDCAVVRPPAGIIASVADYAHFAEILMSNGGSVLQASSVEAMETARAQTDEYPGNTEQYGYGLFLHEGYVYIVRHDGSLNGYQSSIYMVPAEKWAVVVFYNSSNGDPNDVSQFAVDTFLLPRGVKSPILTTATSTWTRYEGTYLDRYGVLGTVTVQLNGSNLSASVSGVGLDPSSTSTQLTQIAGDRFQGQFWGRTEQVTFYPNAGGIPSWFVTRIGVGARHE
jgi:CubicO group peptidase (beta-lactamase class C family)